MTSHFSTRRRTLVVALCLGLLVLALGALTASAAPHPAPYLNGFENANDATPYPTPITDNDTMFGLTRVASGTGGVTSADGAFHATAPLDGAAGGNIFTRYGGFNSVFPSGGYTTSIDIYLDMAVSGTGEDKRIDWSSAISNSVGAHRRDFVFSIGTNGTGGFVMSASNNAPGNPAGGVDPYTITTTGWYTFQTVFRNNGGVLAVDFNVLDSGGTLLKTWTRSDPTDTIPANVGGNRYGWLVTNQIPDLPIDNITRSGQCTTVCYADVVNGNDANGGTSPADAKKTIQAAVTQVTAGGQVYVLDGLYPETVTVNKAVTITGNGPANTTVDPVAGNGFNISASNVTIEDLKVQGAPTHGVVMNTAVANTTFDNVHFVSNTSRGIDIGVAGVTNVSVLNSLFDANGTGIRMASAATVDGFLIENTTFQNHSGSGFNQANDGSTGWVKNLTVRDSTFTNNGTTSGHAGVYAEEFSNVLIEDSTFTGNQYGINLWDVYNAAASVTTNVIVRNNTFTDHKWSTIALQSRTSDPNAQLFLVENNTINQDVGALVGPVQAHLAVTTSSANPNGAVDVVDNTLNFSGTFPTGILATYGVYLTGGLQDVRVEGNEIDGGNVGTNGATIPSSGIRLITNMFQTNADITITKNLINNFVNGVIIHDANNAPGGVHVDSTVAITRNDLSGNSAYGIQSGPATESGGTCNWWGDASGPGGQGSGSGTDVSTHVDYTPWLYSDDLDGDCYVGGTITVEKEAPQNGAVEFEFDPSWSATNITLKHGESETSAPLLSGNYSVSEVNLPANWALGSATCDNEATGAVESVNPASITVAAEDEWVCTFSNVYTPPPTNTCPVQNSSSLWTDIIGKGMGSPKKHKTSVKLSIPNYQAVVELYGQLVAKDSGQANYVRFIRPGKNNYDQVNSITSPSDHQAGNFWYGDYIDPAKTVTGRWFLQKTGVKNHIPRAYVLYPTYNDPNNTYVNVWSTFDAAEGEVYWDTANGWTNYREIVVSIAPPNGPTTLHVELALVDNDKDKRPVWITVTAGGVTQTVKPINPDKGDQLNILVFDLAGVPAGTDEIVIELYSPSMALDGVIGDSAALVGMAANYKCAPLSN